MNKIVITGKMSCTADREKFFSAAEEPGADFMKLLWSIFTD
jgi:hypothetical protein